MLFRHLRAALLCAVFVSVAAAQPARPTAPRIYDTTIRFRIDAIGSDRIAQYFEMMKYLKSIGFVRANPDDVPENEPEDAKTTRLNGTLPASSVPLLFGDRRIRAARLVAQGAKLPDDKDKRVRVRLQLASGFALERQRTLSQQVLEVLGEIGFQEAVGYDSRAFTRLLGSITAGQVDVLLEDLRKLPAAEKLGPPLQNVSPVLIVEVEPNLPVPPARAKPAAIPPGQERLSAELRELLADETRAAKPMRLEILLAVAPDADKRDWLQSLPGVAIEGRLGTVVTVLARPSDALNLVGLPNVVGIRLPRPGRSQVFNTDKKDGAKPLQGGPARLHALGKGGKGVRIAVVDSDFRGWPIQVGQGLPKQTTFVDLTAERNRSLLPDPPLAAPGLGTGTRCALAAATLAPEAEFTLIRVDPSAPYMLQTIARGINGEVPRSLSLDRRLAELDEERILLDHRRLQLAAERRIALQDFAPEGEETQQRKDFIKKQAEFDRDERNVQARIRRYRSLLQSLTALKGIRIVTCGLVWPEGYPVDGSSALSRSFDDRPFRAGLWFQSAGDTRGQAWTGLFRDDDGNGIMEFTPPAALLPAGAWTRELNFLGWRPGNGPPSRDLPADARLRLSLQWRETHDPSYWRNGEDAYREPIANLRIVVLRQEDPDGKQQPADDCEVVAESSGTPLRLESGPRAGTYEATVEFRVTRPGRYAVRIEGRLPDNDRPRGTPTLPGNRRVIEIKPRLFIQTLAGAGGAVFDAFATDAASIGMPGDAHDVTTVGAANPAGTRQPYSAGGPAHNLELQLKPETLAVDGSEEGSAGTGLAAAHAAGLAAALRSKGFSLAGLKATIKDSRGGLLVAPERSPDR